MLVVKNEENVFVTEIKKAKEEGKKVYILGAALGAVRIAEGLRYRHVDFDAFVVDEEFYVDNFRVMEKDVLCLEDVIEKECIIIRSIADYPRLKQLKESVRVIDEDVLSLSMAASPPFDLDYYRSNYSGFDNFYESLQDEKSKQVMTAFINQKITGRFSEMEKVWDSLQYFDGNFYDLSGVECIVDCGAFNGDSFEAFCKEYYRRSGKEFCGKAYLLDPDEPNQKSIELKFQHYKCDVKGVKKGAWNKTETLLFQSDENFRTAGRITEYGDTEIEVDRIDNIVEGQKVGFIKMDIEGAELNALKGAYGVIKRDRPILGICAYHKREDLLELPCFIKSVYPDYKFYLRAYGGPYSIELVLYAVA